MIIKLDAFDLQYCAMFAERQRCGKRERGTKSNKISKSKTEYEIHYIGALGERAVSIASGVPMNTEVLDRGDDGVDFVINGYECHVKAFSYGGKNPEFFVENMGAFTAQLGIGVQMLSPVRMSIMGCISRKRFEEVSVKRDYGYGPNLMVPESILYDIETLLSGEPNANKK